MSASRSAANSPLRCSSHRSAASPSSPDDRQLARARLFLRRKRRTPTGPSSAPSPQQIALNDPLEASRAATAASLSSDRFRHRESISSCLPFSTVTQPALVLFPNQIRIYSQQAPREKCFFTNFYMGLVEGADAVGRFPGARDSHFVQQCQIFLGEQMRVVKPRLLLTLGKEILRPVATPRLSSDLGSWSEMESLEKIG